jgi:hypothetical protein
VLKVVRKGPTAQRGLQATTGGGGGGILNITIKSSKIHIQIRKGTEPSTSQFEFSALRPDPQGAYKYNFYI